MACKKHGYTNNVFCPACDLESIEKHEALAKVRAYALEQGWKFIRVPALQAGGYWKDLQGRCFYARESVEQEAIKPREKGK